MPDVSIFSDPWILCLVIATPLVIIGLAKSWKRFKDKRAEKELAQGQPPQSQQPS